MAQIIGGWTLKKIPTEWETTDGRISFEQRSGSRWLAWYTPLPSHMGLSTETFSHLSLRENVKIYHECIGTSPTIRLKDAQYHVMTTPLALVRCKPQRSMRQWGFQHVHHWIDYYKTNGAYWRQVTDALWGERFATRREALAALSQVCDSITSDMPSDAQ